MKFSVKARQRHTFINEVNDNGLTSHPVVRIPFAELIAEYEEN